MLSDNITYLTCPIENNHTNNASALTEVPNHIKTHGSESRGQEEAGLRDERVSYLQVAPL